MKRILVLCLALMPALVGCPPMQDDTDDGNGVTAKIAASTTSGPAPLRITVTGEGSSSVFGDIVSYSWDFAGQASATGVSASHTFSNPGRYGVTLGVEDSAGNVGVAQINIQVQGGSVTAVIGADRTSGPAPLSVQFDGTGSTAEGDTIRDYFWDFGDGQESRDSKPSHTFTSAGTFTVSLRAVSAGGVEGADTQEIVVGQSSGTSLQFNGNQFASLPVSGGNSLNAFSFEAWVKPDSLGGTIATFGSPGATLEITPGANVVQLTFGTQQLQGNAFNAANRWQFVAVAYDGSTAVIYIDGVPLASGGMTGATGVAQINLGGGFRGNLASVRFWSAARTAAQAGSDADTAPSPAEIGLLGYWPINEGSGQALANRASGASGGTLGGDSSVESGDPAWSTDGP